MSKVVKFLFLLATVCLVIGQPASADQVNGNLVSAQWLQKNLNNSDLLIIDASGTKLYSANHIPGAINVDLFTFGVADPPVEEMERRLQSWGVSEGKRIVIYDQGASFMATRIFWDLYYYGFPSSDLFVLDGGLAKWQEVGGSVTKDPTRPPQPGSFRIKTINEHTRVRLPEFLVASGNPAKSALIEALEPSYHFGENKFFDRPGHVPNGIMLPPGDFFNADKTFKSAEEIRKMLAYLGVRPDQAVHSYCGGGVAASAPFFAMKFIAGYPNVSMYKESQLEWLRDPRELPFWTYDAPFLKRDMQWVNSWNNRLVRFYGVSNLSIVDVRPVDAYKQGHVPFALSIPADLFKAHLKDPQKLAELASAAGINSSDEAVIVSEGGLNPRSALGFLLLEQLGQSKVSVLMESVDDWGLSGLPLTKDPTIVGPRKTPQDLVVPLTPYAAKPRTGILISDGKTTVGQYPKVFLASGSKVPANTHDGKVIHLPYTSLLNANGTPKAAKDIWNTLVKAGVPRYAEIVCFSDDPGEAAVNYFILKLMGYPDVKVLVL